MPELLPVITGLEQFEYFLGLEGDGVDVDVLVLTEPSGLFFDFFGEGGGSEMERDPHSIHFVEGYSDFLFQVVDVLFAESYDSVFDSVGFHDVGRLMVSKWMIFLMILSLSSRMNSKRRKFE